MALIRTRARLSSPSILQVWVENFFVSVPRVSGWSEALLLGTARTQLFVDRAVRPHAAGDLVVEYNIAANTGRVQGRVAFRGRSQREDALQLCRSKLVLVV